MFDCCSAALASVCDECTSIKCKEVDIEKFKAVDTEELKAFDSSAVDLVNFKTLNVTHESFGIKLSVKFAEKKENEKVERSCNKKLIRYFYLTRASISQNHILTC